MKTQPQKGKYKLNTFVNLKLNTEFNNIGVPLKSITYGFKSGDVIDVVKFLYNDKNNEWEAQITDIPQNLTVPLSILTKINDNTPASAINKKAEAVSSGTEQQFFGTGTAASSLNIKEAATWGLGFSALFVFLKWAKLI